MSAVEGLLVLAAGARLEAHAWDGARLTRCAFFNAPFFITSLKVVKSFILLGDVHNGIIFVRYHVRDVHCAPPPPTCCLQLEPWRPVCAILPETPS